MNQEIIRKFASDKMDEIWDTREMYNNRDLAKMEDMVDGTMKNLREVLGDNEQAVNALLDYEDAYQQYATTNAEENFIIGFMEGIKFIKKIEDELQQIKK